MWHKIFGFNKVLSFVFYIKDILISPADGKESDMSVDFVNCKEKVFNTTYILT